MIKLTLPNGESTVMDSIGGKKLLENSTSAEARAFMKKRNAGSSKVQVSPSTPAKRLPTSSGASSDTKEGGK